MNDKHRIQELETELEATKARLDWRAICYRVGPGQYQIWLYRQ